MSHADVERFSESRCWLGGPQTGKTRSVAACACSLARAEEALEGRARPAVLVLCATPAGYAQARARIDEAAESAKLSLRVGLVRDVALEIMAEPAARSLFGRSPRVLDAFEERFLFEDVRTTRFKERRLRKVMGFLCGGWSNLADDDEGWLVTLEEEAVAATLRDNLRFTGGILACELGNLAVNTLRADPCARKRHSAQHVLVDDYPLLDRASQTLARMLAETSFSLAGDPCPAPPVQDDFPYPQGVEEFLQAHPDAEVCTLSNPHRPDSLAQAASRLQARSESLSREHAHGRKGFGARYSELMRQGTRSGALAQDKDAPATSDLAEKALQAPRPGALTAAQEEGRNDRQREGTTAGAPGLEARMEKELADELRAIARICREAEGAGTDVLVVGANGLWRKRAIEELRRAGANVVPSPEPVSVRDFRDEAGCARARAETMARLEGDPRDGVAWRSLVGFGDYMARSAGLEKVRKAAQRLGLGIEEALSMLERGELEGVASEDPLCAPLAEAYRRGLEALFGSDAGAPEGRAAGSDCRSAGGSCRGAAGGGRLDAGGGDPAAEEPPFGCGAGRVMVCSPRGATGHQAPTVVFGGFVNGIVPSRANFDAGTAGGEVPARCQAANLLLIRSVLGRASKRAVLTGFSRCDLEEAERLGLRISRIRLSRGVRVCDIEPSVYLGIVADEGEGSA